MERIKKSRVNTPKHTHNHSKTGVLVEKTHNHHWYAVKKTHTNTQKHAHNHAEDTGSKWNTTDNHHSYAAKIRINTQTHSQSLKTLNDHSCTAPKCA